MKKIIISLSLVLVSWGAFAQHNHAKGTSKNELQPSIKVESSKSASTVIDNYLALKDALVKEDSKNAAGLGTKMVSTLQKIKVKGVASQRKNEVASIIKDASQEAQHIADNSENIAKQREHFEPLTKNVKELILITGSDRALYQSYCPMYNKNKGGAWLSESKEINNPYFGSKMLRCGSVQQEILLK